MSSNMNGKFVVIGEQLGNIEEYIPQDEESIYQEDGKLYAAINGVVSINPLKRTIMIAPAQTPKRPLVQVGDTVVAQVLMLRKFTVGALIYKINKKVILDGSLFGNIHVSNISSSYIEQVSEGYKRGDWLRGEITQTGLEYELSTKGPNYGVIKADCPICGTGLERRGRDMLQCSFCGKREKRKLAADYGNVEEETEL